MLQRESNAYLSVLRINPLPNEVTLPDLLGTHVCDTFFAHFIAVIARLLCENQMRPNFTFHGGHFIAVIARLLCENQMRPNFTFHGGRKQ